MRRTSQASSERKDRQGVPSEVLKMAADSPCNGTGGVNGGICPFCRGCPDNDKRCQAAQLVAKSVTPTPATQTPEAPPPVTVPKVDAPRPAPTIGELIK